MTARVWQGLILYRILTFVCIFVLLLGFDCDTLEKIINFVLYDLCSLYERSC